MFSSSVSWLFQSVMVLRVFSPVTVQRVFTAPHPFVAVQFASFTLNSLVDIVDAIGSWTTEGIGHQYGQGQSHIVMHGWIERLVG